MRLVAEIEDGVGNHCCSTVVEPSPTIDSKRIEMEPSLWGRGFSFDASDQ